MKSLFLAALLVPAFTFAQVPSVMGFQGRILKSDGTPQTGVVTLAFSLHDAETAGATLWSETQQVPLSPDGFYSTFLGQVNAITPTLLQGGPRYLQVSVGASPLSPRQRIGAVAYALVADDARTIKGRAPESFQTAITGNCAPGQVVAGVTPSGALLCVADQVGMAALTGITAGPGLTGGGTSGTVTMSAAFTTAGGDQGSAVDVARGDHLHDARYPQTTTLSSVGTLNAGGNPVDWTKLKNVPAAFADGADNGVASITAGPGLSGGGTGPAVTVSAAFTTAGGDQGSGVEVARGDHAHDARYPQSATLSSVGTLNAGGNPVDWTKLKNVPAAFADGVDNGVTSVTAAAPLTSSGGATPIISLPTSCATNEVLKWSGTAWNCAPDQAVPTGAVQFFNLTACPTGWSALTAAQGRYLVGLQPGGALAGTVGTALSNSENRPVGRHAHSINDPGHSHVVNITSDRCPGCNPNGSQDNVKSQNHDFQATVGFGSSNNQTGISVNNDGAVTGTNAPYLQLLVCQKN